MRDEIWKENWAELELERTPWGKTKFVNVQRHRGEGQVPGEAAGPWRWPWRQHEAQAVRAAWSLRHGRGSSGAAGNHQEGHEGAQRRRPLCPAEAEQVAQATQPTQQTSDAQYGITGAFAAAPAASGHCSSRADAVSEPVLTVCVSHTASDAAAW